MTRESAMGLGGFMERIIAEAEAEEAARRGISIGELRERRALVAQEIARQQAAEAEARYRQVENAICDLRRQTNAPFAFLPSSAVRLSGLTARSNGDGRFARTVVHIRLREDFENGRFSRQSGDFLCTTKHPWDFGDEPLGTAITCPKCRAMAERLGMKLGRD